MLLKHDDILKVQDLHTEVVEVEAWGGKVRIQELTAEHRIMVLEALGDQENRPDALRKIMPLVVVWGVVDEEGVFVFKEEEAEGLAKKSLRPVQQLFNAILALGKIAEEVPATAGKDSDDPPSGDSPTD